MSALLSKLGETVAFIQSKISDVPSVGIVLGSGLGNFLGEINVATTLRYSDIPHFPVSTVQGHDGTLVFGEAGGKKVVAMAGRFHYYEGYGPADVVYPIRVMRMLGVETLLLSNAAGGVNPAFRVGDLMVIRDHISLAIVNPLIGPNEDSLGTRFPDMSEPYQKALIAEAHGVATELGVSLQEGVYFGVTGPTFETHAEYRMIRLLGADAVGMSTVQEAIAAAHMGLRVFAISVITDMGIREDDSVITHEEVLAAAAAAEPVLTAVFSRLISKL